MTATTQAGPDTVTTLPMPPITLLDRCDACSQHAVAQMQVDDTILRFCGHHTRTNLDAILVSGYPFEIPDEYAYQFTDRALAERPRDNAARDAGSV